MSGEDPHPPKKGTERAASKADTADHVAGEVRPPSAPNMLTIVGIGASAGGLQEFEKFFSHVSVRSGLAFVVIQHLAPRHTSILRELIARSAQIPILDAQDGVPVEADHVYVITPGNQLKIAGGALVLSAATGHYPVDTFFSSLAGDRGASAIGIVLSGSGTDGTRRDHLALGGPLYKAFRSSRIPSDDCRRSGVKTSPESRHDMTARVVPFFIWL